MSEEIQPVNKSVEKKIFSLLQNNLLQVRKGANEVTKMVDRSKTLLVVMAADTQPIEIVGHLPVLCNDKGVPFVYVENSEALGRASGLERAITACCIIYRDDREYERVKKGVGHVLADINGILCD